MRLEQMTVHLRSRSAWEAVELGMALVRRDAGSIWKPWLLVSLPLFVLLNAAGWALDRIWLAGLLMWWLKPLFDRIPLFAISRSVFGSVPTTRETLVAQLRWGWRPLLHTLTWRRLSPARSLLMPIDLLEGAHGPQLRERRRVLGSAAYGSAALLTLVCLGFEAALLAACLALIFMFVPFEYLPETARAAWSLVSEQPPWWAQVGWNVFAWIAVSVIEPFFVGAGFGLYLNRRTQIEAWDVEIAFRKLRARLLAIGASSALLLAVLATGMALTTMAPLHAQERDGRMLPRASTPARPAATPLARQAPARQAIEPPTLPIVFGDAHVDDRRFRKAADSAYEDPLLSARRTEVIWQKRNPPEARPDAKRDISWLAGIAGFFAFVAEWALWIIVGVLVVLLLVSARHWLPWMRGATRRRKPLPPDIESTLLEVPETLPGDVPAAARRLWAQGRPRQALALLYRASVGSMSQRADVALPPGATEAQCLRASRRMPDGEDRALFARMVRTWQIAAYARRLPPVDDFESMLAQLQQRFGWSR